MGDEFEDDASFLTVLLESSPLFWEELRGAGGLTPAAFMEQILAFVNAYLTLNDANRLAVFSVGRTGSYLLYRSHSCAVVPGVAAPAPPPPPGEDYAPAQVLSRLQEAMALDAGAGGGAEGQASTLSAALSRALCFVNRLQRAAAGPGQEAGLAGEPAAARGPRPRLLCVSASPDIPSQYIATMNTIFSAQHSGVVVDGVKLGAAHSTFLQQAAHLTGGVYSRPAHPKALLQYLLSVYLPDPAARAFLRRPAAAAVDLRASCFCHKRIIDIGHVCSVCLSIFCEEVPACITCGTEFPATPSTVTPGAAGAKALTPG